MNPQVIAKANALRQAAGRQQLGLLDLCYLLAQLTSADKTQREEGKSGVRQLWSWSERYRIEDEATKKLADFANQHEPRP